MLAVVIPCYKVTRHIENVISGIGPEVGLIVVVDDCCPESSGKFVEAHVADPRVKVVYHSVNKGVGGAVMTGYQVAIEAGAQVLIKIDGDGQMDPSLISVFAELILQGEADYTKGNRFFEIETIKAMPLIRIIGNAGLSFLTKLASGYWNLFDPTNGYTAISSAVAQRLPLAKIDSGYFFESDMLFRLNTLRALVIDIPMFAEYYDEKSNLNIWKEFPRFLFKNLLNFYKRIIYNYFIRNFCYASIQLLIGTPLLLFGIIFGSFSWITNILHRSYASAGTVMLAALSVIIGLQMLLGFINYDISNQPTSPLQRRLKIDARKTDDFRREK